DVIVVGARVAGASTAMLLARRGHRVLLVDRATMPSDVVSTHAILRSGVLQLSRWGVLDRVVAAGTPPVRDITLGFGLERIPFQIRAEYGVDTLYAPRRHLLDAILVEEAEAAGAEFADRTRMVDLLRGDEGQVNGIVATRHGQQVPITADVVIGADGVWSRTADLVGAATLESHPPTNAVTYAYYRDVEAPGFWFQFTPGVNAGIIPTNEGLSCVFAGRRADRMTEYRADSEGEFNRLLDEAGHDLADRVREGSRVSQFRGTSGLPGFVRQAWGPGWALVGDAGYTKDPISAHGISDALRDAELCARAGDRAIHCPEEAVEAMSGYQRVRDELSLPMFRESQALSRYQWDAEEASRRMRAISEAVRAECAALVGLDEWSPVLTLV
ncbi:MAG TPA: NAD(P)/FAD-dependent oxidoreductase, partial [Acidimicrobiia bacterium]|nr:NAD(P)/FAD-dependent oxidoreductase [Acidimicrobiia bacterium]